MISSVATAAILADLAPVTRAHTFSIITGRQSRNEHRVTDHLQARLDDYGRTAAPTDPAREECARLARLLKSCRPYNRCKRRGCPGCDCVKAIDARKRLEARLDALPHGTPLRFVTVTVVAHDLAAGWRILLNASRTLRGRAVWRDAVVGGSAHYQLQPAQRGEGLWLPHMHAITELYPDATLDGRAVAHHWASLLAPTKLTGTSDVREAEPWWDQSHRERFSPLAYYVTRQVRSEWLTYSPPTLATVVAFIAGRRLSTLLGSWWGTPTPGVRC